MSQEIPQTGTNFLKDIRGTQQTRRFVVPASVDLSSEQTLFNKTLNNPLIIQEPETLIAGKTISSTDKESIYFCNFESGTVTLPPAANSSGRILTIINVHSHGFPLIGLSGGDTLNSFSPTLALYTKGNYITVIADPNNSNWISIDHDISIFTGRVNRSDWTNTWIGTVNIVDASGVTSGPFLRGEIVSDGTLSAPLIFYDSSGNVAYVKEVTSGGNFASSATLTGQTSGANFEIEFDSKNEFHVIYHGWNVNPKNVDIELYISSDDTELKAQRIYHGYDFSSSADLGTSTLFNASSSTLNSLVFSTFSGGLTYITASGVAVTLDTEDYYSNMIIKLRDIAA